MKMHEKWKCIRLNCTTFKWENKIPDLKSPWGGSSLLCDGNKRLLPWWMADVFSLAWAAWWEASWGLLAQVQGFKCEWRVEWSEEGPHRQRLDRYNLCCPLGLPSTTLWALPALPRAAFPGAAGVHSFGSSAHSVSSSQPWLYIRPPLENIKISTAQTLLFD